MVFCKKYFEQKSPRFNLFCFVLFLGTWNLVAQSTRASCFSLSTAGCCFLGSEQKKSYQVRHVA